MSKSIIQSVMSEYETSLRELIESENALKNAEAKHEAARLKFEAARHRLMSDQPKERDQEVKIADLQPTAPDDQSHMPKILAFLANQPGKVAKADAVVVALGPDKASSIRSALVRMALPKDGRLIRPKRGYYKLA